MNKTVELQRKSSQLKSDIEDILHASTLNFKALCSQVQHQSIDTLKEEFSYLQSMLESVHQLVNSRSPLFMNYLIARQIKEEEARVRRERLVEYEEKIYDQKRIVTDKEGFFQNLLRPKRKRPAYQTPEEFQQTRTRERQTQEKLKVQKLGKEISQIKNLKKLLENTEFMKKNLDLQYTKSSSISLVNTSLVGDGEPTTERVVPFGDRSNKRELNTHSRSTSMQHELGKDRTLKKEDTEEDYEQAKVMLGDLCELKMKNSELHKIYDQAAMSLKFKQSQSKNIQQSYKECSKELSQMKKQAIQAKSKHEQRYNRVFSPISLDKKRSGSK